MRHNRYAVVVLALLVVTGACGKKKPPVAKPLPPATSSPSTPPPPTPAPPQPVADATPIPPEPKITEDPLVAGDLDVINKNSPLQPVLYALDSYEVDAAGQQVLTANAAILKKYPTW